MTAQTETLLSPDSLTTEDGPVMVVGSGRWLGSISFFSRNP